MKELNWVAIAIQPYINGNRFNNKSTIWLKIELVVRIKYGYNVNFCLDVHALK